MHASVRSLSLAVLPALLSLVAPAYASGVGNTLSSYTFHGDCGDCSNAAPYHGGNGVLTLLNYQAGTQITSGNFVSLHYTSNILTSYDIVAPQGGLSGYISGNVGTGASDRLAIYSQFGAFDAEPAFTFFSNTYPQYWCTGNNCEADYGSSFTFTSGSSNVSATPEPASLTLLGTGMAGLFAFAKRRR